MRTSKYGNIKTVVDGLTFDSKKEAARWQELCLLARSSHVITLRRQVPFELVVNGEKIGRYVADFTYLEREEDGATVRYVPVVEDAKGVRTPAYNLKKRLMRAIHGIEIRET